MGPEQARDRNRCDEAVAEQKAEAESVGDPI
jgi:hypothetical protein